MKITAEQALRLTITEIWANWYYPEKLERKQADTVRGYKSSTELHVLPRYGHLTIQQIDRDDVQAWMDEFGRVGNPGGGEKAYKCLRQIINWSIKKWGLYILNPTQGIELPKKPVHKPETLTTRRLKKLIRGVVGFRHEATVIIQAALGLRPGENYFLSWQNINWRTGLVPIRGTLQYVDGVMYEYPPKTAKGDRDAFLPAWALDRLRAIWVALGRPKGRIIENAKPQTVAARIQAWIKRYRLPRVTMQNLRHTWGTLAALAGNKIEVVAAMMGHTNIQTCYRYYYQLTVIAQKRAQRKVARSILGKTCDDMYAGIELVVRQRDELPMAA